MSTGGTMTPSMSTPMTTPMPTPRPAMPAQRWLPLANVGLRGLGLVGRLGLAVYLVRFFPLQDVGTFGLIAGAVGMAPAVLGWGLNYFVGRAIVDAPLAEAMLQMRRRLAITVATMLVVSALALLGLWFATESVPGYALPAILIVFLECIAFDVQMSLFSLRMSLTANLLLFTRSAAWVFPAAAAAFWVEGFRTLPFLLWCWLGGIAASYGLLALMAWRAKFPLLRRAPHEAHTPWLQEWAQRGWLVYLNDIGIVGLLYFDRYIVSHFLGLAVAGAFTTYWSVANAVHVLIFTGWLQPNLPQLVSAARGRDRSAWRHELRHQATVVAVAGGGLSLVLFVAVVWGLPYFGVHKLEGYGGLFALMLAGTVIRLLADLMHQGLYSRSIDRPLAVINILGIGITLAVSTTCIAAWGLAGAGIATVLTPTLLLAMRAATLMRARPAWH
jgi:O-antigen/teichoic acid export membrane protein